MDKDLKEIGKRIRLLRGELSLIDFEKIIGVSKAALSVYERGEGRIHIDTLMKIAEYGGVSLEWLVYGREPSAPSVVCEELNEDYCSGQDIEKEIGKYSDKIINHLVLLGTDRVIAEKMLDATIQEIKTRGKGDEGYINLGDFLKDARRRLEREAAREARAAEEDTGT